MNLQEKSELTRAGQYINDVISWAVAQYGECVFIMLSEHPEKFQEMAKKYNNAYDAVVFKLLTTSKTVRQPLVDKMMTEVYNEILANEAKCTARAQIINEVFFPETH